MIETQLQSRAQKLANPFIAALEKHPRFEGIVRRYNSSDRLPTPAVVVNVTGGEERLDHPGDSWDYTVTITVARAPKEYDQLDADAAAIEAVTGTENGMVGDPNISMLIAEEGASSDWGQDGKARTYEFSGDFFVVFS